MPGSVGLPGAALNPPEGLQGLFAEEWRALRWERDPELRAEGLLHLGRRLETRGGPGALAAAGDIYRQVGQIAQAPAGVRQRAALRLDVLSGGGPLGARVENMLGGFVRQATDPALLMGMGVASGAFQATRFVVWSRLAAASSSSWLTRGFGVRLLAGGAGLALEAPAFTLATRAGHAWLGRRQDWSREALAAELASAYLTLGALKLGGGAAAIFSPRSRLAAQGAMFGALLLTHRAEAALGWRASTGWEASLTDSLATLAQFAVAGRLSRAVMGESFAASLRSLEARSSLGERMPRNGIRLFPPESPSSPAWALAGAFSASRPPVGAEAPSLGLTVAMSASGRPGGGEALLGRRLDQLIEPELGRAAEVFQPSRRRSGGKRIRRIGILTSGGDGPAENAAIAALVQGAHQVYGWRVTGILDGYRGLIDPVERLRELRLADVQGRRAIADALRLLYGGKIPPPLAEIYGQENGIARIGGTILRSSRTNPLHGDPGAEAVHRTLRENGIDALVVIGGNGSMRAAAELQKAGVPLVGLPQSIDGDVWGSEHSIGFPSAVAKGASEVYHYMTTASACRRWFLVEVMGQRYGLLTLAVAERSLVADAAFIETPRPFDDLRGVIESRKPRQHGVILVSEGVKFRSHGVGLIEPPRGEDGHGRLLIEPGDVARWLRRVLAERRIETQTRSESLGYLLRGADTVYADQALAGHLSLGALKLIAAGRFGHMIGTAFSPGGAALQLHSVPLSRVARNEKGAPLDYYELVRGRLEAPREDPPPRK